MKSEGNIDRKYRTEIDGLRAIAILSVLFGHLEIPYFSGGYIGVDVFFVISGFLITNIIIHELNAENFSLINFYERRIRRIVPALYFLLFVSSLVFIRFLFPEETISFSKSIIATALYMSNIFFFSEAGYFDAAAASKPLLHTWSLGIEEQFYFIFPILLIVINKYLKDHLKKLMILLLIISLIFNVIYVVENTVFTFYLLPSRFWELLLGGILAIKLVPLLDNNKLNTLLSFIGMFFIFYGIFTLDDISLFPGFNALYPTLGAFLIIYSNSLNKTIMGHFLSWSPLRFLGLISYSLYLWHWTIIVFYRETIEGKFDIADQIIIIIVSLLIATLSWYFIENPIRRKKILSTRKQLFTAFAMSTIFITSFSLFVIIKDGLPGRFEVNLLNIKSAVFDRSPDLKKCAGDALSYSDDPYNRPLCVINKNEGVDLNVQVLVWGDSHADASVSLFKTATEKEDYKLYLAAYTGCPPLIGLGRNDLDKQHKCKEFNDGVLNLIKQKKIKNVFLIARWSVYFNGKKSKNGKPQVFLENGIDYSSSSELNMKIFKIAFKKTIDALREENINIWIIKQPPEYIKLIPKEIIRRIKMSKINLGLNNLKVNPYGMSKNENMAYFINLNKYFNGFHEQFKVIDLSDFMCPDESCYILMGGQSLYRDSDHITNNTAKVMGKYFEQKILYELKE